ncbi:serine/threonine-protein kinase [Streptomyces sp. DH41]|uniref:serine/threonine-protein kinase n=1 Tax=Streptomyces sp. DH41 TaxID=3040125 RepID=UPI002441F214|nr:serine/threonine-protein kinase [Streptomyces sp. DH41]MDG9725573.1 serine/threonine-protein kinase [Streptomyces sp. DH41]
MVYLGYRSTRPVAVKVVRPQLAEDEYFRRRFALELEAIRRVGGFHTAALVAADPHADTPWIATQYIHAPSLLAMPDQCGAVSEIGAWWLAAGLADALMHIHSVRLLHRDLKPANVLVAADGARVIDFGISHVNGGTGLTTASAALGTLAYMAPEQAKGPTWSPVPCPTTRRTGRRHRACWRRPWAICSTPGCRLTHRPTRRCRRHSSRTSSSARRSRYGHRIQSRCRTPNRTRDVSGARPGCRGHPHGPAGRPHAAA